MIKSFYVITYNINAKELAPYDVIPYFLSKYKKCAVKDKPKTFDEFKKFIESNSMYQFWSRCEYEIIISSWPPSDFNKKVDVHEQIMMNLDLITTIVMNLLNKNK